VSKLIKKRLIEFCMAKGIEANSERFEIQARYMADSFNEDLVIKALSELFKETQFFPDASLVANKINSWASVGDPKSMASEKANRIIAIIHECGFDSRRIRAALGERVYNAIGGHYAIDSYGQGETPVATFKAQSRDAIMPLISDSERLKRLDSIGALSENVINTIQKRKHGQIPEETVTQ